MENERFELQNVANTVEMAASSCKWQGKRAEKQTQHDPTKKKTHTKKLDDGWPESVEEQSLLLLVWKHYITRQYIKDV